MAKKKKTKTQINLSGNPIPADVVAGSIKKIEERIAITEQRVPKRKVISEKELKIFPNNIKNIDVRLEKKFKIEKTLERSLAYYKAEYNRSPQFGTYILNYGLSLLEHGKIIEAAEMLDHVCGSENFDNEWPPALRHRARIAAFLDEFEYTLEYLRRSFRAAASLAGHGIFSKEKRLKELAQTLPEFQKYRSTLGFRLVIAHNYANREDFEKYSNERYPFV